MTTHQERFIEWCRAERDRNQQQLDLFAAGTMRTSHRQAGEEWVDTTEENEKRCRRIIADMSRFIDAFETQRKL